MNIYFDNSDIWRARLTDFQLTNCVLGIKATKLYTIIYHLRLDCPDIFSSLSRCPAVSARLGFVSFRFVSFCTLFLLVLLVDICRNRAPRIIFRFAYQPVDCGSAIKTKARNAADDDDELVCRWLC